MLSHKNAYLWLFLTISDNSEFSQTRSGDALLLKMIPWYQKQDLFGKNMGIILG